QGAAGAGRPRPLHRPSGAPPRRGGGDDRAVPAAGGDAGRHGAGGGDAGPPLLRRRAGPGPAVGRRDAVGQALRRARDGAGLGLDAGARHPPPQGVRPRVRPVRPRRLAGAAPHRRGGRCSARPGDARLHRGAGPVPPRARPRVGRAGHPLRRGSGRLRAFARLYEELDRTTSTNAKVAAMAAYFRSAPPGDAAWALFFLTQRKVKRLLPTRVLWELTLELTGLPPWLLEHCYAAVGDGAELGTLLVDRPAGRPPAEERSPERWMRERILPLKDMDLAAQALAMRGYWSELDTVQIFVLNKIITGEFRVGASATLAIRALAQVAEVLQASMAHRVMGDWQPSPEFFRGLLAPQRKSRLDSHPYPFFLASPLEEEPAALGPREEWMAEWKWDGIRAQLVRRGGAAYVWSRGEELVTERFPEIAAGATRLPD